MRGFRGWSGWARWYSWMPSSVKAQARGEVNEVTAGSPCSNKWAHSRRWPSLCERPAPAPDGPKRAAVAVLAADLFQPLALVAHEIAEAPAGFLERGGKKREVARRQQVEVFLRRRHRGVLQQIAQQEGAGVVIGAIALEQVRHVVDRVLEDARAVGHACHVVESNAAAACPGGLPGPTWKGRLPAASGGRTARGRRIPDSAAPRPARWSPGWPHRRGGGSVPGVRDRRASRTPRR